MKKLLFFSVCYCLTVVLQAQNYHVTDAGSEVKFTIKNFGLNVAGSFKGLKGAVVFDPSSLAASSVNVTVDAATVNTGNGSRDKH
jgi:polyisoprenoid-binding protein YceI